MKEYNIAIIAGIFTIMAALVPIILSKRRKKKTNAKIKASSKLFELSSSPSAKAAGKG